MENNKKSPQVAGTTSEEVKELFSKLESAHELKLIELHPSTLCMNDSMKERVFQMYQILNDGNTPNVFAYLMLDTVRIAFDNAKR